MAALSNGNNCWITNGDFSYCAPTYPGVILRRSKEYTNNSCCIKRISLNGYVDNTIRMYVEFVSDDTCAECKKIMPPYAHIELPKNTMKLGNAHVHELAHSFLSCLMKYEESVEMIISDICSTLGLDICLGVTTDKLLKMSVKDACDYVVKAQQYGDDSSIYQLIQAYFEKFSEGQVATPQEVCDLIDSVKGSNKHYQEAQDLKFKMLMMQDKSLMTPEETHQTKEQMFVTSLKSGDQQFADSIFNELCGFPFGSDELKNIKPDEDTLLMLAMKIDELQTKLSSKGGACAEDK